MKKSIWILGGCALVLALISWPRTSSRPNPAARGPETARPAVQSTATAPTGLLAVQAVERGTLNPAPDAPGAPRVEAAPVQPDAQPETVFASFDTWANTFLTHPSTGTSQIEEGRRLAVARREALAREIKVNPRRALERAVSWSWRQRLPAEIAAYLEEVVVGRGKMQVYFASPLPGADYREFPGGKMRYVTMVGSGRTYSTYVYGRRLLQMSQDDIAIHGIAVGNLLALHENPARLLDADEGAARLAADGIQTASTCSICGAALHGERRVLDYGGQRLVVCGVSHAVELNRILAAAEVEARRVALASGGGVPVGGNSAWTNPPPENPVGSWGSKRVLFMRLVFRDDTEVPISESEAAEVMHEVNDFYVEASYNKASLVTTVTPVLTLPFPKLDYSAEGPGLILVDAIEEARKAGFAADNYDFIVMRHPNVPGFTWGGLGGGGVAWLQGNGAGLIIHELGHVFGLGHANFYDTQRPALPNNPNNNPFDMDSLVGHDSVFGVGDDVEYGDVFDVMGSGGGEGPAATTNQQVSSFAGHFNAIGKNLLGWLPDPYIAEVTEGGTNRIYVHDTPRLVQGRLYALKVRKDAQRTYWVSARGKVQTPYTSNGVELHFSSWQQALGYSQLLDTTPGSMPGRQDAPIAVGRTYADEESKVYITPTAKGGAGTNTWYDLVVHKGPHPDNVLPAMELTVSTNFVRPGGSVTFTVSATDDNGDALAYYWDMSDGAVAPNSPSMTRLFAEAGQYVVRVEVSDMKGGLVSKHAVISVGSPGTFRISGQVISTDGLPLQRVRVSNGSLTEGSYNYADDYQWTYTDADGAFTLVNLSNRTYSIGAHAEGYITRPLNFDTSITIADKDAEGVLFMATRRPVVTAKRVNDAVVASATPGLFELTRTGDTNTALQAVFLLGGSAVAGADYADWTNIVTQTNVTPNPFGDVETPHDFYAIEFPTGVVSAQIEIMPLGDPATAVDKEVALTLMYPLQFIQLLITNGVPEGTLATNTNVFNYSGWELRSVNGVDTWFQTYSEYLPAWPGEARLALKGVLPALPTVSVIALVPTATENLNDGAMFTVARSGPTTHPLSVTLEVGGTATPVSDYIDLSAAVVIPAGSAFVNLPVVALEDLYLEGNETVTLKVVESSGYTASPDPASVTIVDNDMPRVTIVATDAVASESGPDTGIMIITREGDMNSELLVSYLVGGTAVSGRDYRALSGTVTIPAGQPMTSIVITPRDNGVRDGGNTVEVYLADRPTYNIGTPNTAKLFIADRALPVVTVTASDETAAEPSDAGELTFTRTGDVSRELVVDLKWGGNAKPVADYTPISRIRFPAAQNRMIVSVSPVDDRLREDPEYIVVTILPGAEYNVGAQAQAVIALNDDDGGSALAVGFDFLTSSAFESAGEAYLAVTVTGNPAQDQDVTVQYKVTGGTAIPDVDYPLLTSTGLVVFPHNPSGAEDSRWIERTKLIALPINDNQLLEPDRTIVVTLLEPPSWLSNWLTTNDITITNEVGEPVTTNEVVTNYMFVPIPLNAQFDVYKAHTLTILDDDSAIVTVEAGAPQVGEGDPVGTYFRVRREGPTNRVQKVLLQTSGFASNGSDYQPIPPVVEIPIGEEWIDIPLLTVDDPVQEFMEDVTVMLLDVPGGTIGGQSSATIQIVDNDGTVEFTQTAYTASENVGTARIPVRRTGHNNTPLVVNYSVLGVTATPGADFAATNGTFTFAPGETVFDLPVIIVNDPAVEPAETVRLILTSLGNGAPIGGQTYATLTILDDDSYVEFASANYRVTENGTNAAIALRRIGAVDNPIEVDFAATNGTATDGIEFVATNYPVAFAPGVTNATVLVRILDNTLIETNKTVQLSLATNAVSGGMVGPQATALLEVANDDCALEFAASEYSVDEFARVVTLDVRRLGGAVNAVSVDYTTTNGTAQATKDYVATAGTLRFAGETNVVVQGGSGAFVLEPGETNRQFQVRVIDNSAGEGNRSFGVLLSNPRGPAAGALPGSTILGEQVNTVVTIIDDELPGSVDFAFNPGLGADGPVNAVAVQPDGKIVLAGAFATVDGTVMPRVARLHEDGYLDSFFNPGAGPNDTVHAVAVQPDGRILLGGEFTTYSDDNAPRIARLTADGLIDSGFNPGAGANRTVRALAVGANGAIVLGGDFLTVGGVSRPGIARLMADGSLDQTFNPGAGAPGGVFTVAIQSDGKVLAGGGFSSAGGANYPFLARFNADGTVDRSFNTGTGPDGAVRSIAVGADGKVIIGGDFVKLNNVDRARIARLNADGSLDAGFDPRPGANQTVYGVGVQTDRKVVLAGNFTEVRGQLMSRYARLNPNGTVDDGFLIFQGADALIRSLALQSDTALVVGGDFTTLNGLPRRGIGRVHGDEKFILSKIQFSSAAYRLVEDQGPATITVVRSGDLAATAQVDFLTSGGSAVPDLNYQPTNGTLLFLPGETEKTFEVQAMDDHAARGNVTVGLVLTNLPSGYALNAQLTSVLTIEDKESVLAFSSANYSVLRSESEATITVVRTGPSTNATSVDYVSQDDTAQAGVDYLPVSGTLVFDPGVALQTFTVPILTNSIADEPRTLVVALANAGSGAVLGALSNAVLSIVNEVVEFYSLNLTPPVGGSVTPGSDQYPAGSSQILTAAPDEDYRFDGWEGTTNTSANPLQIVMNRNYTLTARFVPTKTTYSFEPPFQAADLAAPPWANSTTAPWQLQSLSAAGGRYALRSGVIGNSQETRLELTARTRAGAVSFMVRVSSEANWDFFEVYLNGVRLQRWSGDLPWQRYQFNVPAGVNRFTWRYVKDANFNFGLDAAFIDDVYLPLDIPDPTPVEPVLSVAGFNDGVITIKLEGRRGVTYVLEASEDLEVWTPIGTETLQAPSALFFDTVAGNRPARFYRALAPD